MPVKRDKREWKQLTFPKDTTIALFHLGITSTCYAALVTGEQGKEPVVIDSRPLWLSKQDAYGNWKGEPKVKDILRHERELRGKASGRGGHSVKGEQSDPALRSHIRHMEIDRYKKTARRIMDYALNNDERRLDGDVPLPEADIVIIGDFSGVVAKGENPRQLNRLINLWKRPQIVALVKDLAAEAGIRVFEASSWGGSQVCSRCGEVGRRYLITRRRGDKAPEIRFSETGKHFACAACGHRDNAEKNAVFNLVKTLFSRGEHFDNFRNFLNLTPKEKGEEFRRIEQDLLTGAKPLGKAISV